MLYVAFVLLLTAALFYLLAKARAYRAWELRDMAEGERLDLAAPARPVGQLVAVHSMPPAPSWAPGLELFLPGEVVHVLARTAHEARMVVTHGGMPGLLRMQGAPGFA